MNIMGIIWLPEELCGVSLLGSLQTFVGYPCSTSTLGRGAMSRNIKAYPLDKSPAIVQGCQQAQFEQAHMHQVSHHGWSHHAVCHSLTAVRLSRKQPLV
jgi:hypothetical protein